jgi:hypothetical protein
MKVVTRSILAILCLGSLVTGTHANTVKGARLKHDPNRELKKDGEKECKDNWYRSRGRCWNPKKECKCPNT